MKTLLSVVLFTFCGQLSFASEPKEVPQISLNRTSSSSDLITGDLAKNIYKYVERVEEYIEKVPYIEMVPYTVWETYTTTEWVCRIQNGKEVCRWETVTRSRLVTRYREEIRYRDEVRSRIVTDKVFKKQWGLSVTLEFPKASKPLVGEVEKVSLKLVGSELAPDVEVEVLSQVFAYQVADKTAANGVVRIRFDHTPLYSAASLGASTITDFQMVEKVPGPGMEIRFNDKGLAPRVTSQREVVVSNISGKVLAQGKAVTVPGYTNRFAFTLPAGFNFVDDYLLQLNVNRTGESIQGGVVNFSTTTTQYGLIDAAPYTNHSNIQIKDIIGAGSSAKLIIHDLSPNNSDVKTDFTVSLYKGSQRFFFAGDINRKDYDVGGGEIEIPFANLRNWDGYDVSKYLVSGAKIKIEVSTFRSSKRLGNASPVLMRHQLQVNLK